MFVFFTTMGILFAGDECQNKVYVDITTSNSEIVLKSKNLQLLKYTDENGDVRFTIINNDGTVVAENMSRLELRNDFPEIEKKFKS